MAEGVLGLESSSPSDKSRGSELNTSFRRKHNMDKCKEGFIRNKQGKCVLRKSYGK